MSNNDLDSHLEEMELGERQQEIFRSDLRTRGHLCIMLSFVYSLVR
jgi:hypothetical protein